MKGIHPRVTIWKVRNTLRKSGVSEEAVQAVLSRLSGAAKRRHPVRIPRDVQKKISEALAEHGKCGLYITRSRRIFIVGGDKVTFKSWEAGEAALVKFGKSAASRNVRGRGRPSQLSPELRETLVREVRANMGRNGLNGKQIAFKHGVNPSTVSRIKRDLQNGAEPQPAYQQ